MRAGMANLFWTLLSRLVILPVIATGGLVSAQDRAAPPFQLEYVDSAVDGELDAPTSVVVSPDGRFVYASAYKSGSHAVFARDQKTGTLKVLQTVKMDHLAGSTSLRLSRDGNLAAAASFRGRAVSLYRRDPDSGLLTNADIARSGEPFDVRLQYPIDLTFSHDGRYVDVLDSSNVAVFEIVSDGGSPVLKFVESFSDPALLSCRGIYHHPSGRYVFVASNRRNSLVVLERDDDSGKLTRVAVIEDESDGATGLESVFGVTGTADGDMIYTVSGQHGKGDDSVSVFSFDDGTIKAVQCIVPFDDELGRITYFNLNRDAEKPVEVFRGGNEIVVSPDGSMVVACATLSASLAVFSRDQKTGRLTMIQIVLSKEQLSGVSGIGFSPDNRHVYSANEFRDTISVFQVKRSE